MSRYSDVLHKAEPPPLPVVDWASIGQTAPRPVPITYQGPDAPLPTADIVVLTWTSAEWSALDHVFLNSNTTRAPKSAYDWHKSWYLYSHTAPPPPSDQSGPPLWGYYQMVEITTIKGDTLRVLLFKCDSHLAHPPWFQGLYNMLVQIINDVKPQFIYSIGTAGGSREDVRLGDVVITNAAEIKIECDENAGAPNNQTFVCDGPFPATTLLAAAEARLFFDMSTVVTDAALQSAVVQLHDQVPDSASFGLSDLLNSALSPGQLHDSKALPMPGIPLLTTDYYYIATGTDSTQWPVLEMDDAVIGYVAGQRGIEYAFVRNVSDPLVPNVTSGGVTIPFDVRKRWSGLIYEEFGLYTSFNGAVTTWATIAGHD